MNFDFDLGLNFMPFFGTGVCQLMFFFIINIELEKDPVNSISFQPHSILIIKRGQKRSNFHLITLFEVSFFLHFQFFHHRVGFSSVDFPFLFFLNFYSSFLTHVLNSDAINHEKVDKNERNPNPPS